MELSGYIFAKRQEASTALDKGNRNRAERSPGERKYALPGPLIESWWCFIRALDIIPIPTRKRRIAMKSIDRLSDYLSRRLAQELIKSASWAGLVSGIAGARFQITGANNAVKSVSSSLARRYLLGIGKCVAIRAFRIISE